MIVTGLTLLLSVSASAAYPIYRSCPALFEGSLNESEFGKKLQDEIKHNLFDNSYLPAEQALDRNQKLLRFLETLPVPDGKGRKVGISEADAGKLIERITQNPVAGPAKRGRYDPRGNMGFCFGRAMTAHLLALESGVHKDSVLKLFAVGSFKTGDTSWRYHVTTIVRGVDGDWWTIDTVFGYPMRPAEWYKKMLAMDRGDMNLFVTEAKRFDPTNTLPYSRSDNLSLDSYRGYFTDLLHYFRGEAKKRMLQ